MLVVLDFHTITINEVIDWVLDLYQAQKGNYMAMEALQHALPRDEDLRPREDTICYGMGSICGCSNDVWTQDCTRNIPADHNVNLWRIHSGLYAGIPRRFCRIQLEG